MKTKHIFTLILLSFLTMPPVSAANVSLYFADKNLNVKVDNIHYPKELLMREMKSGLPNVLDMMIKLMGSDGLEFNVQQRYIITYDLWDEHYSVSVIEPNAKHSKIIKTDAELLLWLSSIQLNGLGIQQVLLNKDEFKLSFQTFFNPVKSDRIKRIQSWIRTSKGYDVPEDELNSNSIRSSQVTNNQLNLVRENNSILANNTLGNKALVSSGPRFQKLFDKILEDHMSQDAVAAQWKSKRFVKTFTTEKLVREKR